MSDISLSKAVRSNLLSLKGTADMMAETQTRLSTGNKVNSALDNPSNWFTAKGLTNRASDLNALMDSMANGIQTLKAADNGLSAMTKTLESMQSTLRQARQDKSFNTESLTLDKVNPNDPALGKLSIGGGAVGSPVDVALTKTGTGKALSTTAAFAAPTGTAAKSSVTSTGTAITYDATATAGTSENARTFDIEFGGKKITVNLAADATRDTNTELVAAITAQIDASDLAGKVVVTEASGLLKLEAAATGDGDIKVSGTDAVATFGATPTSVSGTDGKTTFTVNGKAIELTSVTGADLTTAIASVNTQLGTDSKFQAYNDAGKLGLRAISDDAGTLTIGGSDARYFGTLTNGTVAGTDKTGLNFTRTVDDLVKAVNENTSLIGKVRASNDNGKLRLENQSTQDMTITGKNGTSGKLDGTTGTSTVKGNSVRSGLADQFNELRDQLDKLSDDASFNGINLLRGDKLAITFNETGTSSIDIQTKNGDTINSANLGVPTSLEAKQLDSDVTIDGLLADMKTALNQVRSQASTFGSNLSIVQNRQDFTKAMIDTLENGAGNLTLADMNEEAANLLALQTRQQLSSNSLSLASQADQSVLQLLR
ncbi:flagellin [Devosia sp. FKR38]|uniref:flagellin N-terminal helical domain-containing protein n=1 Tax=Devosia sp. FKR38 TaxID=2562312 RepID=UPI0010C0CECB|nr:flagellin [Devosia sp. FKR38]